MSPSTRGKKDGKRGGYPSIPAGRPNPAASFVAVVRFICLIALSAVFLFVPAAGTTSSRELTEGEPVSLPWDIVGYWEGGFVENCEGWQASLRVLAGDKPDMESVFDDPDILEEIDRQCKDPYPWDMWHFQDCLELTVTAGEIIHHMVMDGKYVLTDWYFGVPVSWHAAIEEPLPEEAADGGTAALAFHLVDRSTGQRYGTPVGIIRRYFNWDGDLVIIKRIVDDPLAKAKIILKKTIDIPLCRPLDESCGDVRTTDVDRDWTVACCEAHGGDDFFNAVLKYPRPQIYFSLMGYPFGQSDCRIPPPPTASPSAASSHPSLRPSVP